MTRIAIVLVALILGVMQFASDGLLQASAAPASVPRLLPHAEAVRLFEALPLPQFARVVAGGVAVEDGRLSDARSQVDSLPSGADRADLEGRTLQAQGHASEAVTRYIAAGDLVRVAAAVDYLDSTNHLTVALATQRRLIKRLRTIGDLEALAYAEWRLAQIEAKAGEHAAAVRDYRAALQLEPLNVTYLLGAANESLGQGHADLALQYYQRVLALDPASRDGREGFARVQAALRR